MDNNERVVNKVLEDASSLLPNNILKLNEFSSEDQIALLMAAMTIKPVMDGLTAIGLAVDREEIIQNLLQGVKLLAQANEAKNV